jgi:Toprim domain
LHTDHNNSEQSRQKHAERLPCPVHGGKNPNVSIWTDTHGRRRAKCHSYGCSESDILRALREAPIAQRTVAPKSPLSEAERLARAREMWSRTEQADDTLAELYLRVRGITVPTPSSLRYEPHARHPTGVFGPAMAAAIVREDQVVGVQCTFLKLDPIGKAALQPSKVCMGIVRGGCVRLAGAAETLVLCEGIETGLSILQATALPTWAALGAGNLAHIVLPDIVREVIIGADHDANSVGLHAAYKAADRLIAQERKVRIALPSQRGHDFNDILREGGDA